MNTQLETTPVSTAAIATGTKSARQAATEAAAQALTMTVADLSSDAVATTPDTAADEADFDQVLAITAEGLFLSNLLMLPGISFLILVWLRWRYHHAAGALARCHIAQTFFVSLWGLALLVMLSAAFIALIGLHSQWTWVVVIIYFTCIHSTLVLVGVFGLSRAISRREFVYPLIGVRHY